MKRIFFSMVLLSVFISCGRNQRVMKTLCDVESYVHEHPDSALRILSSVDTACLTSQKTHALYSLLVSIADYKLYIDETSDKDLSDANKFFRAHHDNLHLLRGLFLQGYYQFNQGNYSEAIITLTEAEFLIDKVDDNFYAGLICRQMAWLFEKCYNRSEQLDYNVKAYDYFAAGGFDKYSRATLRLVGLALSSGGRYEEAEKTFLELNNRCRIENDSITWAKSLENLADNYISREVKDPESTLACIHFVRDSLKRSVSCYSLANCAFAFSLMGDKNTCHEYFDRAKAIAQTEYERYYISFREYESYSQLQEIEKGLIAARESFDYLIASRVDLEKYSMLDLQRDFIREQRNLESLNHDLTRQRFYTTILLFVIVLTVLFYLLQRIVRSRARIQESNEMLHAQLQEMSLAHSKNLKSAFQSGMQFFNKLVELKWQEQSYRILPRFESMLQNLATDPDTFQSLKTTLNVTHNNLINRLVEQVPLKKDDILIYCYLANQMDHTAICTILNRTPSALNSKIYRIREKIEKSNAPDKIEFLNVIKD